MKAWIFFFFLFFRVSKQGPCFPAVEEDGDDKRLLELEFACNADGVAPPDLYFCLAIAANAEAILMRTSADMITEGEMYFCYLIDVVGQQLHIK